MHMRDAADVDTQAFYRHVSERVDGLGMEEARQATGVVLRVLRDHLTREQAEEVAVRLPAQIQEIWRAGDRPGRRPLAFDRDEFLRRVKQEAGLLSDAAGERLAAAVLSAVRVRLPPGEAEVVLTRLPKDLQGLWIGAS
jgi:uncharacterized protein (DUF2267 family)